MERPRTESAREHDDSDIIEASEDAPSHGGVSGGNLQRDIGSRDEEEQSVGDGGGVTRVRGKDKPEEADRPTYSQR